MRNFANRLLLFVCLAVVAVGSTAVTWVAPLSGLSVAADSAITKTYYFNEDNQDAPSGKTLYEALGVLDYNQYLIDLAASQPLKEVVVAVVDSGLDMAHPVFKDRVLTKYALDFSSGIPNRNDDNRWYQDDGGHGTHVAGIIADMTLPNVKILPVRIFSGVDSSGGSDYAFENAIRYLCALKSGESVQLINNSGYIGGTYTPPTKLSNLVAVNLSLGTAAYYADNERHMDMLKSDKPDFQSVINHLLKNEILPIVAAGNIYKDVDGNYQDYENVRSCYALPAACDGVVAVSAYDNTVSEYALAAFSYHNDCIGVAAPGVDIWSACSSSVYKMVRSSGSGFKYDREGGYYYHGSSGTKWYIKEDEDGNALYRDRGTSMATPFVTACYAMLMGDPSKTTAEDYGLPAWDLSGDDQYYLTYAHKALLAAAMTYGNEWVKQYNQTNHTDYEPAYNEYFGYGIVSVQGFGTADVVQLVEIAYETTPSTNFKNVVWSGYRAPNNGATDWYYVCLVLLVGAILIWGINLFKAYFNRRVTNDRTPQQ